jgi:bacterioferritin
MSCPCCGGISAAELVAAMDQLVCDKTVLEGPYCHCDDVDGCKRAPSLPAEKATCVGLTAVRNAPRPARQEGKGGTTTREDKANRETVIGLLNTALATKVTCILRYKRHYAMTTEISARRVHAKLLQHMTEEQAYADHLAERIVQLGGEPVLSLEQILNRNDAEPVEGDSLAEMIMADLHAELNAIHNYENLIASVGASDPATRQLLEWILVEEASHAENLASLLKD